MSNETPLVGVIMGSRSDVDMMQVTSRILADFGIPHEIKIVSAHRTPGVMFEYAMTARERGLKVIIAGAGGAAHLPGMVASLTTLPVIGVPLESKNFNSMDSVFSILSMPADIPVGTMNIGRAGAINAALYAAAILGYDDKIEVYRKRRRLEAQNDGR